MKYGTPFSLSPTLRPFQVQQSNALSYYAHIIAQEMKGVKSYSDRLDREMNRAVDQVPT